MRRYRPGHYVQSKSTQSNTPDDLKFALSPGFVGALVDLPWAELEPKKDAFDFTMLEQYLSWGEKNDRIIIGMPFDRDFKRGPGKVVPTWIPSAPFNAKLGNAGSIAKIWLPAVTERRIKLLTEIARAFGDHPQLEALVLPETALGGINEESQEDFVKETYRDEIIRLIETVAPAFNKLSLFQSLNWLGPADGSWLDMIAEAFVRTGIGGVSNPDTVPWAKKPMYLTMARYAGKIPVMIGGDVSQLMNPGNNPYYSGVDELVAKLYETATSLQANYQLWETKFVNNFTSADKFSKQYQAAIAKLVANSLKGTNTTVPEVYDTETPTDEEMLTLWAKCQELQEQLQSSQGTLTSIMNIVGKKLGR